MTVPTLLFRVILPLGALAFTQLAVAQTTGPLPPAGPASTADPTPTVDPVAPPAPAPPPPPGAVAQAPVGEVTVFARDGAVFRGVLVEKVPGQYVTLRLATGELRRVAWDFIARIDGDVAAERPKTFVTFRADHEAAELEEWVSGGDWVSLCRTPCKGHVRQGETLRVGGPKVLPSEPFKVPPGREQMRVEAQAVTRSQRIWGAVLGVGGGSLLFVGSMVFLIGSTPNASVQENNGRTRWLTDRERRDFRTAGGVIMALGAGAGVTGLILLLEETEVEVAKNRRTPRSKRGTASGPRLTPGGFFF